MKKFPLFLLLLISMSLSFQACDKTKTYAEKLEDEEKAINSFIKDHNITVISQSEFYANDSTTDASPEANEFVHLTSGVYMQIVDKGSADRNDTIKANDIILVRFMEYGMMEGDTTLSNLSSPETVDEFKYTVTSSSIAGIFQSGYMYSYYGSSVPAGWLVPLVYVRNNAHVRLIVPSKMGHNTAIQYVYPYYYDIRKYQIYKKE
jgi:hypothetical protein